MRIEAEVLCGWIALRFLDRAELAARHFALAALNAKIIDLSAVSSVNVTPDNKGLIDLTDRVLFSPDFLVVKASDTTPYKAWDDLKGQTVAAQPGAVADVLPGQTARRPERLFLLGVGDGSVRVRGVDRRENRPAGRDVSARPVLREIAELGKWREQFDQNKIPKAEKALIASDEKQRRKAKQAEAKTRGNPIGERLIQAGFAQNAEDEKPKPWRAVPFIGFVAAAACVKWFASPQGLQTLDRLCALRISPKGGRPAAGDSPFMGKTCVLTGALETMSRGAAQERIRALGGNVSGSVSKKTDFLVAGSDPGTKLDDARKLGVRILNESEFLKLIGLDKMRPNKPQGELF